MSELHVRQIRANLEKMFKPLMDVSDVAHLSAEEQANSFLSRSLAAFAIAYLANVSPEDAAKSITDGFQDNGIDAIYYHPSDRVLHLVQSKWHHDGAGTITRGEVQKFLKGFRDLLNARWERFNDKVKNRSAELDTVLDNASNRIVLHVIYTGQQKLSDDVQQDISDVIDEINDPTELLSVQVLRQGDIYSAIAQGLEGAPIDVDVALYDWARFEIRTSAFMARSQPPMSLRGSALIRTGFFPRTFACFLVRPRSTRHW